MDEQQLRALPLLAPCPDDIQSLDGEWLVAFSHQNSNAYAAPDLDDSAWEKVRLPHLRHATVEQDMLWYRYHFRLEALPHSAHTLLRFGGAFYQTRVWLNGVELGSHEGYFQPFGFDVSNILLVGENTLAVCCHFPVEAGAFKRKTAIAGIFTDWDCKPYPSTYYPHLPEPYQWTVPLGLWQPVALQPTGALLVEAFNLYPEVINPRWTDGADRAYVHVVLQLRNLTRAAQTALLNMQIAPHNFAGSTVAGDDREITLAAAESRRIEYDLTIERPRLWFPWTHGDPNLYRATLTLASSTHNEYEVGQVFGVRAIQALIGHQQWQWSLNGRPIFPKGSNYITDFYLDRVSTEGLTRDLALVRNANLDIVRMHAHIGTAEFYRLCDEQGLMVMCDFPMIWTYAFNLPAEEQSAFDASVHRQVEEMIGLLGSHPSIVLWSIHNEPPWTPDGSFLGSDVHAAATNRHVDQTAAARVQSLDPTRPVIAASGLYDQHLYHGWYIGNWRDNRDLAPPFPTEFGVQALPNLDSSFWGTVNTNWPVAIDDPTWAHVGFQSVFWVSPGVGGPAQYQSLTEYIQASQAYQAFYIRYVIDQWRRKKFTPVGGYIHFLFTDGWPAITWSVLDYYRLPKAGYQALAQASNPAHVCVDIEENYRIEAAFHLVYQEGAQFRASLYLVNDDYRLGGNVQVRWWIEPRRGWLRPRLRRWFATHTMVPLPRADGEAQLVTSVAIPLPQAGKYQFCVQLLQHGHILDQNC